MDDKLNQILMTSKQIGHFQDVEKSHTRQDIQEFQSASAKSLTEEKHFDRTVGSNTTQNVLVREISKFDVC